MGSWSFLLRRSQIGYGMVLEWRWRGQTIGKRIFGLRVMDAQGLRLELPQIALRNLLRLVDMLPRCTWWAAWPLFFSRNAQRLGDLAANTMVARERRGLDTPDLERIAPAKYNSLLAHPHLAARLRSLATPEAAALAVRAVALRDGYDPAARIALFASWRRISAPGRVPRRCGGRPYRRAVRARRAVRDLRWVSASASSRAGLTGFQAGATNPARRAIHARWILRLRSATRPNSASAKHSCLLHPEEERRRSLSGASLAAETAAT